MRAVAVLLIPALGLSAAIVPASLARDASGLTMHTIPDSGAGWLAGSAWVYDTGGRVALGAHAALVTGEPGTFYRLGDLVPGDVIVVVGDAGAVSYRVTWAGMVSRWDVQWTQRGDGPSTLALITCTARDDWRYVVNAERIDGIG